MNVMISKGPKLFMNLHFPHSNMPAYRKIPVNLTLFSLVASTYFDKCKIASNTPPATHLALSDI